VSAAFHDHRFAPLAAAELPRLRFGVTILDPPEPAASPAELDPARYGVIVTAADGRTGVLLPGIASVKTADQQVAIARNKGNIGPGETVTLQRFQARSFQEPGFVEAEG
jgi:MEMO1 family protein